MTVEDLEQVVIPYGANASDTATLLLEAAYLLDLPAGVVRTTDLGFVVPAEVVDKARLGENNPDEAKPVAKKAAAKQTASKE